MNWIWQTASSFFVWEYLGIGLRDFFSIVLIIIGGYLTFVLGAQAWWAKPLRFLGVCLIVLGAANFLIAYGDREATNRCNAAWQKKGLENQIAELTKERDAANLASSQAAAARDALEKQANDQQQQLDQWTQWASGLHILGRNATADDDKRMCKLLANAPAGCVSTNSNSRAVRRKR